ncbi:MAG: DUF2304 family protein [Patescibacteria group bacterium]|nr:DUF2304 family protein [Patescibacteria group bacterium]
MIQQIIALIIIFFLLSRLFWQKKKGALSNNEFIFWLFFWLLSALSIALIKWLDKVVASMGFSGPSIQVLLYLSIVFLFYIIFRLRLRLEKIEKNITKIIRELALKNKK